MHKCRVCKRELPDSAFHKSSLAVYNYICKECKNKENKKYKHHYKERIKSQKKNEANFEHALGGYIIRILNHTKPFEHKYIIQATDGGEYATDSAPQFMAKMVEICGTTR